MQLLTRTEIDAWLTFRKLSGQGEGSKHVSVPGPSVWKIQAKPTYAFARAVVRWLAMMDPDQILLVVFEHGIWSDCENTELYYSWRRQFGDHRLIETAPGHLVLKHEHDQAMSIIHMSVLFGWGVWAVTDDARSRFRCDHDGNTLVAFDVQEYADKLASALASIVH